MGYTLLAQRADTVYCGLKIGNATAAGLPLRAAVVRSHVRICLVKVIATEMKLIIYLQLAMKHK